MRAVTVLGAMALMMAVANAACAPAASSAPPQTPAPAPLVAEDPIGRTLESEGLLGALERIDAELGPTLVSDKPAVVVEGAAAKQPPPPSFDERPLVTWGSSD